MPHWSFEYEYFFAIKHNTGLERQLFTQNSLVLISDESKRTERFNIHSRPSWFIPDSMTAYDIWMYADQPRSYFSVFRNQGDSTLFIFDRHY